MTPRTAFVLAQSEHGMMIVNRLDEHTNEFGTFGVGWEILEKGSHASGEVALCCNFLRLCRKYHGDGVVAIDGGANIGSHAVPMARTMFGEDDKPDWGTVLAIEAQERVYYALCGNLALNNCLNAVARWAVLDERPGMRLVPEPDYRRKMSFGSLELSTPRAERQEIGQDVTDTTAVHAVTLDDIPLTRCDLVKLDLEGMEMAALRGGVTLIEDCRPILVVEWQKTPGGPGDMVKWIKSRGYEVYSWEATLIAVHKDDPVSQDVRLEHVEIAAPSP